MISSAEALDRLRQGNTRFERGELARVLLTNSETRNRLVAEQAPFAVVLGCSDSRAPAEVVFDQGLGDLFVIRVAGNVVSPSQIASVEFAVARFGTPLVVVMGHTRCGAVAATIEELLLPPADRSATMHAIVDRIRPAVEVLMDTDIGKNAEALSYHAIRANIRLATDHLRHGSRVIEEQIQRDELLIVGAEYSIESGRVDFFDIPGPYPEGWGTT
ncbi:MAG: carbonic anhydrase [Burkholderiaceae bacterium]